jgi:hypothetical protein
MMLALLYTDISKSGLACLQMILQWSREDVAKDLDGMSADYKFVRDSFRVSPETEKAWMIMFVATKSIWTIDLVLMLQHILTCSRLNPGDEDRSTLQERPPKFSYLFCSTKFGVDESYSDLGYYKDAFRSDELRVKNLFRIARKRKLPLLQVSRISLQALVDVVSKQGVVALALLDNRVLRSNATHITSSYSGHYVIVCGISRDENDINYARMNSLDENERKNSHDFCVTIKNPGSTKQVQFITPSIFEKAWRAKGTDQDVIFIAKHSLL